MQKIVRRIEKKYGVALVVASESKDIYTDNYTFLVFKKEFETIMTLLELKRDFILFKKIKNWHNF